jgi:hypothetical protein
MDAATRQFIRVELDRIIRERIGTVSDRHELDAEKEVREAIEAYKEALRGQARSKSPCPLFERIESPLLHV